MSYIHKITGDVYHDILADDIREEEFFECDEMIAPIISILNKKGFKTQFCCSGHAYPSIEDYYAKDTGKIDINKDRIAKILTKNGDDSIIKITKTNIIADSYPFSSNFTVAEQDSMDNVTYIYFDCEMPWDRLPPLPKGWTIDRAPCGDSDVIRYNGPWFGLNANLYGFDKLEMIFKGLRALHKWAVSLDWHCVYMQTLKKSIQVQDLREAEQDKE